MRSPLGEQRRPLFRDGGGRFSWYRDGGLSRWDRHYNADRNVIGERSSLSGGGYASIICFYETHSTVFERFQWDGRWFMEIVNENLAINRHERQSFSCRTATNKNNNLLFNYHCVSRRIAVSITSFKPDIKETRSHHQIRNVLSSTIGRLNS